MPAHERTAELVLERDVEEQDVDAQDLDARDVDARDVDARDVAPPVAHVAQVVNVAPVVNAESVAPAADTIPGARSFRAFADLADDDGYRAFRTFTARSAAELAPRAWDNLAHVQAFARAAVMAADVVARFDDDQSRRQVVHALWPLLPLAARAKPFAALPDDVAARGPDYAIRAGDVPRIAPSACAFLGAPDVEERLFRPGAGPFLVPKAVCPAGAPTAKSAGTATAVVLDEPGRDGFKAHVPASTWTGAAGERYDVRTGPDKKPILSVDGKPQPLVVSADTLGAFLFSAGPDARGLDLRGPDDRALLLTWSSLLRSREVKGRSVFAWLEDDAAPLDVRAAVVTAAVACAIDAVARHAADVLACRVSLRPHANDGGWPQKAAALLDETALFRDVAMRAAPAGFARDVVWLDAFLRPGFASGRLSPVAAGRAFARLATSVLAPLGVLPLSGLRDGSGGVVLHRLVPRGTEESCDIALEGPVLVDIGAGLHGVPLWDAWAKGRGTALPEPRNGGGGGAPRHDVQQMPAWLSFFLEGVNA